jgi:hypothetical protein
LVGPACDSGHCPVDHRGFSLEKKPVIPGLFFSSSAVLHSPLPSLPAIAIVPILPVQLNLLPDSCGGHTSKWLSASLVAAGVQAMPSISISGMWSRITSMQTGQHLLTFLRLNEDYIVFRGGEHEAASAHLKGTLVLCLSEPLAIKHIRLELTGMSRVWYVLGH